MDTCSCNATYFTGDQSRIEVRSGSVGLIPDRIFRDNYHRTFRFTMKNERALADMVKRQALGEYLTMIGVADPEAEIKRMKFEGVLFNSSFEIDHDDFDDVDDFEEESPYSDHLDR